MSIGDDSADILVEVRGKFAVVSSVLVPENLRRRGIGHYLYSSASAFAKSLDLPLVSDMRRSHFAEAFWRKALRTGNAEVYACRARGTETSTAAVVWSPLHSAEGLTPEDLSSLPVPIKKRGDLRWPVRRYVWVPS